MKLFGKKIYHYLALWHYMVNIEIWRKNVNVNLWARLRANEQKKPQNPEYLFFEIWCSVIFFPKKKIIYVQYKQMNNCLIVLAAGIGSRYGSPKQFDSFLGEKKNKTILHYSLKNSESFFNHYIFVIRKETESLFHECFKGFLKKHTYTIVYQPQELSHESEKIYELSQDEILISKILRAEKPCGTAHAVMIALPHIPSESKSFMIMNADDYYGKDSIIKLCSSNYSIIMVGYFLGNTLSPSGLGVNRGICTLNKNNFLEKIEETKGITSKNFNQNSVVSMNLFSFQNEEYIRHCFHQCWNLFLKNSASDEFVLPEVIKYILENDLKKIQVIMTEDKWVGLTYREDKDFVKEFLQKEYEEDTLRNLTLHIKGACC